MKLVEKDGAVRVEVHAKPRAKKSRIVGPRGDAIEVRLAAPPVDGAANDELIRLFSETFGVPKRQVRLIRGETSAKKLVAIEGVTPEAVRAALGIVVP